MTQPRNNMADTYGYKQYECENDVFLNLKFRKRALPRLLFDINIPAMYRNHVLAVFVAGEAKRGYSITLRF